VYGSFNNLSYDSSSLISPELSVIGIFELLIISDINHNSQTNN